MFFELLRKFVYDVKVGRFIAIRDARTSWLSWLLTWPITNNNHDTGLTFAPLGLPEQKKDPHQESEEYSLS